MSEKLSIEQLKKSKSLLKENQNELKKKLDLTGQVMPEEDMKMQVEEEGIFFLFLFVIFISRTTLFRKKYLTLFFTFCILIFDRISFFFWKRESI